jgi:hypothetical protein
MSPARSFCRKRADDNATALKKWALFVPALLEFLKKSWKERRRAGTRNQLYKERGSLCNPYGGRTRAPVIILFSNALREFAFAHPQG